MLDRNKKPNVLKMKNDEWQQRYFVAIRRKI
jgi:hypothetical protein